MVGLKKQQFGSEKQDAVWKKRWDIQASRNPIANN
jgi:hypothetical protein